MAVRLQINLVEITCQVLRPVTYELCDHIKLLFSLRSSLISPELMVYHVVMVSGFSRVDFL